jgi:DNA-binding LacI/PurR family transcriptional regulator
MQGLSYMVTTYDIAKLTGLNQSTVSRVLSGFPNVSPKTAKKVYDACQKLNFVPNASARALKTSRTFTLAIHMPYGSETVLADPFIPIFLSAVSREAARNGYSVIISYADSPDSQSELINLVKARRVDGVILTSPSSDDPGIKTLIEEGVPFVTGRHESNKNEKSACVDIDNYRSGFVAGKFLISQGHSTIGLITESKESIVGHDFQSGFMKALDQSKIKRDKKNIKAIPVTFDAAYAATMELLSSPKPPSAIIANTTLTVFGAIEAVRKARKNITVMGIESPLLKSLHPDLPRIQAPIEDLGCQMAGTLIKLLETGGTQSIPPKMLYTRIVDEKGNVFVEDTSS